MDAMTVQRMALSWMRRKRWEADMTAISVVSALSKAMGGKGQAGANSGNGRAGAAKISGAEMLSMMGVQI